MKSSVPKPAATSETPVFPKTLHQVRQKPSESSGNPKSPKRDKIFSKSRDTREDRGTRQAKTTHNSQTLPHGR
jgi:hypothetical protein